MSKDDKVLTRGPFKGKKITFASTERIEEFKEIASEFMREIFDLLPGEYLISDESDLHDFTEIGMILCGRMSKRSNARFDANCRRRRLPPLLAPGQAARYPA